MASTVAFTIALGSGVAAGARLVRRTFKAVHPEVPFFIIDGNFYRFFAQQPMAAHAGEIMGLRALIGYFLGLSFDRVIYFDSDVLVLSPLPRLVEGADPAVLTNDVRECTYGLPAPIINAGVLAAASAPFWRSWMRAIYSHLLPIMGNFFDQFILRVLCENKTFPYVLLPEREDKDYYNLASREEPGEWRREGGAVFKGEARVRLWHWAGFAYKPTLDQLPPPVREQVEGLLAASAPTERAMETSLLTAVIKQNGEGFLRTILSEMQDMRTFSLEGLAQPGITHPGLYGTDVPGAWDVFRPMPEGYCRRLLPRSGRFVYAREEVRLHAADVESLDIPGLR